MKATRVLVMAVSLLATATTAHPQVRVVLYGDDRLAGIAEVDVVVSVTGDGTTRCAVSRPSLQMAATNTLRAARIRATVSERASSWHYSVLVNVHTSWAGGGCVSAFTTELVAQVEGFPEADKFAAAGTWGSILIGPMSLVRENDLVTSPSREHDADVQAAARAQVAALAERIRRAKP